MFCGHPSVPPSAPYENIVSERKLRSWKFWEERSQPASIYIYTYSDITRLLCLQVDLVPGVFSVTFLRFVLTTLWHFATYEVSFIHSNSSIIDSVEASAVLKLYCITIICEYANSGKRRCIDQRICCAEKSRNEFFKAKGMCWAKWNECVLSHDACLQNIPFILNTTFTSWKTCSLIFHTIRSFIAVQAKSSRHCSYLSWRVRFWFYARVQPPR